MDHNSKKNIPQRDELYSHFDIGQAIKNRRRLKKITGEKLGASVGISQSKISKIESGAVALSTREFEKIANILGFSQYIRQQALAILDLDQASPFYKYRSVGNYAGVVYERERNATHMRTFVFALAPALLQTLACRQAHLTSRDYTPVQVKQVMAETIRRQDLLLENGRSYHFILHEAVLYTKLGTIEDWLIQLDRIERMALVPHIRVGIIPTQSGMLPNVENTNFTIYDNHCVVLSVGCEESSTKDPVVVAEHSKVFSELEKRADYGRALYEHIDKARQFFQR